ncbi:MAG: aspartate--ammonia ligase [Erysipelotrichaceae bacterium]|nr:aspartate--ammonia ligase [Erysipelotrichaceae bacterium]
MKTYFPDDYHPDMSLYETQEAISLIKRTFQKKLSKTLHLKRVSAPLFVEANSGLNDDLNGIEEAVSFKIPDAGKKGAIVHSLAKWKRMALYDYDFFVGNGLYTDMNAIRKDEKLDNLHSIYVDQWDWEKVITREERNLRTLRRYARDIHGCILETLEEVKKKFPQLKTRINKKLYFITSEVLLQRYPDLDPKERENRITREKKSVFIIGIGNKLSNGEAHDGRAPDYDDWDLNGDLIYYDDVLDCAIELSSMGIRVDALSLDRQLNESGHNERRKYKYHKMILNDELPLTIGGGIGQSRLCMLLMHKAHIGEVQSSLWDDDTITKAKEHGVIIL